MSFKKSFILKGFAFLLAGALIVSCGKDDDPLPDPVSIQFSASNGSIAENSTTPFTATISSTVAAPEAGSVKVDITGATYGTDYTTSAGSASFTASFTKGATFATFSIQPVDNSEVDGNKSLQIALSGATGLVQLGSTTSLSLTITDDDMEPEPMTANIADIRAMYTDTDVAITTEMIISGIVISSNDATNNQNMVIQNGTEGILIRFDAAHAIPRGQSVEIDLNGGTITDFNNLVQVGGIALAAITDKGAGTLPTPQVITITQLNTGEYESEIVTIEGGSFAGANGTNTVDGNNDYAVGMESTIVRVSGPDWNTNILPRGMGNVTGVAGVFRDDKQVLPQVPEDFFMDMDPGPGGGDPTTATIGEIRAMWSGSDVAISTNTSITGIIISSSDANNNQNVVLQSGGDGIVVRFSEAHSFTRGNELTINLNGGTISDFNNLVQITDLPLTSATDNGAMTLPIPQVITVTEFLTGDYQSELVSIENVTFPAADGLRTVNGNNDIAVGSDITAMRVSGPMWSSNILPLGSGTITGIGGVFSSTQQLMPQIEADIFASMATGTLTITQSITDYGSVMTGVASPSQSYTVATTTATSNVVITAPGGFQVSLDDMMFASSVELDFNNTNASAVTVYIRFNPDSGVAGTQTGSVVHTTSGIATASFSVSGTEDSNLMTIAGTSFEEGMTGTRYMDTGDPTMDHDLVNNTGESEVDFTASATEMGYDATYVATRMDGSGLTDGDDVGVVDNVNTVGSFTDGSKGYEMSDTDGKMVLTFDAIDVSMVTTAAVSLDLFIQSTGWESDDAIRIFAISDGSTEVDVFNTTGMDIDDTFGSMEGMWNSLSKVVSASSTIQIVIELDSNSGSENIFFDNVKVVGSN